MAGGEQTRIQDFQRARLALADGWRPIVMLASRELSSPVADGRFHLRNRDVLRQRLGGYRVGIGFGF